MKDENLKLTYLHKFIFVSVLVITLDALKLTFDACFQCLCFFCLAQLGIYFHVDVFVL
jgi:hypothetical protein